MATRKKVNPDLPKVMSLFDHLSNLKGKKTPWAKLSESDRKSFSSYMVNRFLSMNTDYIDLVNQLQKYTIGFLDNQTVYQLYCDILPVDRSFSKYIKGSKEDKYEPELVELVKRNYLSSKDEAEEYIDLLIQTNHKDELIKILKKFGKSDKEIKKLIP